MIIVSGLPFSGTALMVQVLKNGGLTEFPLEKKNLSIDFSFINNNINKTEYTTLPSIFLKKIEKDHIFIFMERNIEECFSFMKNKMGKEPHKNSFKLHLQDIKRYLKNKDTIYINYSKTIKEPNKELKKIEHLISNFEKAIKVINNTLYRNLLY